MTDKRLKIRDLTMRDGQQSLFATRMPQKDIDRLLPLYEHAGFYILEVWGGAVPDSVMRYLDESPWERLRSVSRVMKGHSLLSALSRGRNLFGYKPYPTHVLEGFYKEAISNGLNVMRIFDALNDINNVRESISLINELGGIADGAVCYTVDPKSEPVQRGFFDRLFGRKPAEPEKIFTDSYFVEKAVEMERLGAKIITLKDMAGLVSPLRAASIISALKAAVKVPVDFHTHCTPGYGLASSLMAVLNGVDILDTNIWYFGGGSAAPAIELIYVFCRKLGIEVEADMEVVAKIRAELKEIRKSLAPYDLRANNYPNDFDPLTDTLPAEIDALFDRAIACGRALDEAGMLEACHAIEKYFNFPAPNELVKNAEVPGGMYTNMVAQLKALKAEDLLEDAMKLIPKVRRDAGLIPLVTPTSQIVGSQAVNLALDRRKNNSDYATKSNEFISLVKGEYGKTPVAVDPEFRRLITGSPEERDYDVNSYRKPENAVLAECGGVTLASNTEEELLLELLPNVATPFLRRRREAEHAVKAQAEAQADAVAQAETKAEEQTAFMPITGEVCSAPMGGKILSVNVKPGDRLEKGQTMLVYEAMKMENDVVAEKPVTIRQVFVTPGQTVGTDAPLIEFE